MQMNMNVVNKKIENIFCKYYYPKYEIKNIIIAIHGFAGDKESSVIRALAEQLNNETLVVCFDLPCHGEDNREYNKLNLIECFEYVKLIIDHIKKGFKQIPISIFATSFGAYLFLHYLKNNKSEFRHIILRCPAIFMDKILCDKILHEHNISLETLYKTDVDLGYNNKILIDKNFLKLLKENYLGKFKFSEHIDIIQGDKDDIVDIKENEIFYKTNLLDYTLYYIKGADHRFKKEGELKQIVEIVRKIFFLKNINICKNIMLKTHEKNWLIW